MEDILMRVRTDEIDGNEAGNEWTVGYVLLRDTDPYSGLESYDIYCVDLETMTGPLFAQCRNLIDARTIMLSLGEEVIEVGGELVPADENLRVCLAFCTHSRYSGEEVTESVVEFTGGEEAEIDALWEAFTECIDRSAQFYDGDRIEFNVRRDI